jgi:hypothetical protein
MSGDRLFAGLRPCDDDECLAGYRGHTLTGAPGDLEDDAVDAWDWEQSPSPPRRSVMP